MDYKSNGGGGFDRNWVNVEKMLKRGFYGPSCNMTEKIMNGLYFDVCMKRDKNYKLHREIRSKADVFPLFA